MNRVIREIVTSAGGRILAERLLELERPPWTTSSRRSSTEGRRLCSIRWSRIYYAFMRALHAAAAHAGLSIPMLSCSLCEPELKLIGCRPPSDASRRQLISKSIEGLKIAALWRGGRRATARIAAFRRRTIHLRLRHAACPRHPPRGFRGRRRRVGALRQINRYDSPQGRFGSIPTISLLPHAAAGALRPGCQFTSSGRRCPERPDPYLSNLDLVAIGTSRKRAMMPIAKRSNHLRIVK